MNTASPQDRPRVALIAGPTASGKSALALALAERTGGVIVNADASQVYRDLRILTARPSPEDEARAPHRLFGHVDAAHPHSAAEWAADARAAILTAYNDARPAIIVGGSGLYIRTLLDGIAPVPPIAEDIRSAVRALPITDAFTALAHEDPEAAARLRPSDRTRIARALEVIRSSGRTLASWQRERVDGMGDAIALAPLVLLPPRDWLRARCNARFMAMLAAGAEPEVAALAARDLDPALPAMRAIGVREIMAWQSGVIDRETMLTRVQAATRRYAKRQFTWLAHQLPTEWPIYDAQLGNSESHKYVIKFLYKALTR